jgi:hypothetical protein
VDGFEDRGVFADVGAWGHAQTADQAGHFVRQDVAEQVGRHQHVELPRVEHQLHGAGVDDAVVDLESIFVLARDIAGGFEEQPER